MKFFDFETIPIFAKTYSPVLRNLRVDEIYKQCLAEAEYGVLELNDSMFELFRIETEYRWFEAGSPFYNLWPCILPMLSKVDLGNLPATVLKPPLNPLLLRFPDAPQPLTINGYVPRTIFVWAYERRAVNSSKLSPRMRAAIDIATAAEPSIFDHEMFGLAYDVRDQSPEMLRSQLLVPMDPTKTVAEVINAAVHADKDPTRDAELVDVLWQCARICATLCLVDKDSELLNQIVLSADREKYDKTGDEKYVVKAMKRGIRGWDVGRHMEVIPHLRRPHFAIRWMGTKPNLEPKLRPVKATLVHRDKIVEMPTGYADELDSDR